MLYHWEDNADLVCSTQHTHYSIETIYYSRREETTSEHSEEEGQSRRQENYRPPRRSRREEQRFRKRQRKEETEGTEGIIREEEGRLAHQLAQIDNLATDDLSLDRPDPWGTEDRPQSQAPLSFSIAAPSAHN